MLRAFAILLTIVTGLSGLVYEVTWQKYVATLLGSHSEATASILGIFLAGLSLGYSLFGRVTARRVQRARRSGGPTRLFLLYAVVEAGIGLYALAFPWLFGAVRALSTANPHAEAGVGFAFDVFLVALLITPPTVLMGGTIPILTQALSTSLRDATRFHALVYGCNTAGAFAGALLGTFVLVPALGLHGTMRWTALLNLGAGLAFGLFELSKRQRHLPREAAAAPAKRQTYAALAFVGMLTGFAMMVIQNVSIRLGGLALGSSEYTFGMVVAVFVLCIALGSLAVSLLPRVPSWVLLLNQCALLGYSGFLYATAESLPGWALFLRSHFGTDAADFLPFHVASFLGAAAWLGPTAMLSGATLPLLFHHLKSRTGELGSIAGALYGWNTLGSFLGALLGGYALLFFLDLHQVFRVALAALAASVGLLAWQLLPRRGLSLAATAASLAALTLLPYWDPEMLTLGLFRHRVDERLTMAEVREAIAGRVEQDSDRVIFHEDDPIVSVTVRERLVEGEISRALITNGKGDGETGTDYPTMALAGLIPAMLVPDLSRAFVIGYGTGVSVGELAVLEGMEEVVVAEISPGVLRAAPLFDFANLEASTLPNVRTVRSDAYRAFVRSESRYDVIVSEPSNPWTTGVEMLFSAEFLSAARARLSPNGVYVQWYHQYETDSEAVELVLRTFASVFDRVAVWYGLGADFLILGMQDPDFVPDVQAMRERMNRPDIQAGLRRAGIESFAALLAHELMPVGVVAASELEGPIHTLYRPLLNHVAGRAFFRGASGELPRLASGAQARIGVRGSLLRRYLDGLSPEEAARARRLAAAEACRYRRPQCLAFLAEAIRLDRDSPELASLLERVYGESGRLRVGGRVTHGMLQSVLRLALPNFAQRSAAVPLETAEHATQLYRHLFQYAAPFDPDVLLDLWERCRAPGRSARCAAGLREARALDWRADDGIPSA